MIRCLAEWFCSVRTTSTRRVSVMAQPRELRFSRINKLSRSSISLNGIGNPRSPTPWILGRRPKPPSEPPPSPNPAQRPGIPVHHPTSNIKATGADSTCMRLQQPQPVYPLLTRTAVPLLNLLPPTSSPRFQLRTPPSRLPNSITGTARSNLGCIAVLIRAAMPPIPPPSLLHPATAGRVVIQSPFHTLPSASGVQTAILVGPHWPIGAMAPRPGGHGTLLTPGLRWWKEESLLSLHHGMLPLWGRELSRRRHG